MRSQMCSMALVSHLLLSHPGAAKLDRLSPKARRLAYMAWKSRVSSMVAQAHARSGQEKKPVTVALLPANLMVDSRDRPDVTNILGSEFTVINCAAEGCDKSLAVAKHEPRRRYQCSCGAPSLCTGCR